MQREQLIKHLTATSVLKTPRIIEAFRTIDRADFVPPALRREAYENHPLPIGHEQTISQPETVAFLLELLEPEPGNKVLDVGAGSGWTTALLAHIIGTRGKVIGIELVPELAAFGKENVGKYSFLKKGVAEIRAESAENGFPEDAPFDRILSGAAARKVPDVWKEELSSGGRIVMPIGNSIWLIQKKKDGAFEEKEYPGFAFVPFISKK